MSRHRTFRFQPADVRSRPVVIILRDYGYGVHVEIVDPDDAVEDVTMNDDELWRQ